MKKQESVQFDILHPCQTEIKSEKSYIIMQRKFEFDRMLRYVKLTNVTESTAIGHKYGLLIGAAIKSQRIRAVIRMATRITIGSFSYMGCVAPR